MLRLGAVLLQCVEALPTDWQARLIEWISSDAAPEKVRWMISSTEPFFGIWSSGKCCSPSSAISSRSLRSRCRHCAERRDEFPLLAQQALESCNHSGKQLMGFSRMSGSSSGPTTGRETWMSCWLW